MAAPETKSKFLLITEPGKCVGCLLCQMRCSFRFTRAFGARDSRIHVEPGQGRDGFRIEFAADCDRCALCARYCVYGALVAEEATA